ncbi:uncharacterized protein CTHT_0024200 [Thermochaetoides thermophila DSM 1495]|uniref:GPI anchored serine-rich protein n=1 Tax=Chaetomium thermophilum (strain DSM 1495 / CBS 144.50 / IMI 039719) TaxID=759272 RepID=G0S5B3_CHATD|nr:hypothetical protein CTHT_0024200 [Thermochaetoides thermophila DSM 1495]EGS20586.1 hypothetical protein CTHT_0024200 [Thermochaetoides thermophila DSM 1495]
MRFTLAVAALAGVALAGNAKRQETVYQTVYKTITSCAPTVTECPASSTVVESSIIPIVTEVPEEPSSFVPVGPTGFITETVEPACPTQSVKTIHTSVTTVIPTVIYETVDVPCPTGTNGPSVVPTGAVPTHGAPPAVTTLPVTAGAAALGGSTLLAAAAGLFALLA